MWMVMERLQGGDNGSTGAGGRGGGPVRKEIGVGVRGEIRRGVGGNKLRQVEGGVRHVEATP